MEFSIVPGRPGEDAGDFARLFHISAPEYAPALFAGKHEMVTRNCFRHKNNLLGFEHTSFLKVDGHTAGMIVAYGWPAKKAQSARSGLLTIRYMKWTFLKRMKALQWSDEVLGKMDQETYYISNLALYPEFRNRGLGTELLVFVEAVARQAGAGNLDVDAEIPNQGAVRFYKRFGMTKVEEKHTGIDGEEFDFVRLRKPL